MREYLSPGVNVEQIDNSILSTSEVQQDSAIFIGGFTKGKAFVPMIIKDTPQLIKRTGQPNGKFFSQYAAYQYSKISSNFYVQRLLWSQGYQSDTIVIYGTGSGITGGGDILAVLSATGNGDTNALSFSSSFDNSVLKLAVSGSTSLGTGSQVTSSYTLTQLVNIQSVISDNPYQPDSPFYLFAKTHDTNSLAAYETISCARVDDLLDFENVSYKAAVTPWVTTQTGVPLFRFAHTSDGSYTNKDVKVHIKNIVTGSSTKYTKFDIIIRKYDDTEKYQQVYEAYYEVNLNPLSQSFIGKVIGDAFQQYNSQTDKVMTYGDYANKSAYVRVQMSDNVKFNLIPRGVNIKNVQRIPLFYESADVIDETDYPTLHVNTSSTASVGGYDVTKYSIKMLSNPIMLSADGSIPTKSTLFRLSAAVNDMIIPFYGGFDGRNPSIGFQTTETSLMGFDVTDITSSGVNMYKKALDIIKNTDQYNIDLISIAGVNIKQVGVAEIFRYALQQVCQYRGDCVVVSDLISRNSINFESSVTLTQNYDSSYGGVYFPAVKYYDTFNRIFPIIPVTTLIPAVFAYTKRFGAPHYAPAGIDRGVLNVIQALTKLNKEERDLLYKNRINPIASFSGTGTIVWGQKTLYQVDGTSALDRFSGRNNIIAIKKWIERFGRKMVFVNNTASLRTMFSVQLSSYLDGLVSIGALYEYKFVMDQSNNTPDVIDSYQLVGQLKIKVSKVAQVIRIPINLVRTRDTM